ncbi:hypothetical protein TorRG33x02_257500, partial [Trema orientale]
MQLQRNESSLWGLLSNIRRAWCSKPSEFCEAAWGSEVEAEMNLVRRLTLVSRAFRSIKAWIWRREAVVFLRWSRYKHFLSIELHICSFMDAYQLIFLKDRVCSY